MVQVHVLARVWGFESPLRHQSFNSVAVRRLPAANGIRVRVKTHSVSPRRRHRSQSNRKGTMPTQLDQILAHTLLQVRARKTVADIGKLERQAAAHTPRGFRAGLQRRQNSLPPQRLHPRCLSNPRSPRQWSGCDPAHRLRTYRRRTHRSPQRSSRHGPRCPLRDTRQ